MLLHSTRKFPTVHHEGSTRCSALARTGARRPGRRCLCLAQPSPSEAWQRFVDGVAAASATASAALKRELDFEAWAPRSSRAWRLRELPAELSRPDAEKGRTESTGVDDDWADVPLPASALRAAVERSADSALTGAELRALCEDKYGVAYDMAIKAVEVNKGGMDRFVALNLYASALGQRSFPYTEAVFMEKLDCVALMLAAWGCSDYVRAFFRAPVAPRNGLPSRPRVDTAVTLRLNSSPAWDPAAVEEWFTS